MWIRDLVGPELKRPVWAFAVVSVLCVVLLTISTGRVDAVLGVFDAPRPISAPVSSPASSPTAGLPETSVVETVPTLPEELTAFPVGAAASDTGETTDTGIEDETEHAAPKAAKKAEHAAAKAAKKADHEAAKAAKKADHDAAKAAKKSDKD